METQTINKECKNCEGTGQEIYSCCGDEIAGSGYEDIGLCPTCKEHTGGECSDCNGTGIARTEFEVELIVNKGTTGEQLTRITATAETEEEAKAAVKKYTSMRRWVITEYVSINKIK